MPTERPKGTVLNGKTNDGYVMVQYYRMEIGTDKRRHMVYFDKVVPPPERFNCSTYFTGLITIPGLGTTTGGGDLRTALVWSQLEQAHAYWAASIRATGHWRHVMILPTDEVREWERHQHLRRVRAKARKVGK